MGGVERLAIASQCRQTDVHQSSSPVQSAACHRGRKSLLKPRRTQALWMGFAQVQVPLVGIPACTKSCVDLTVLFKLWQALTILVSIWIGDPTKFGCVWPNRQVDEQLATVIMSWQFEWTPWQVLLYCQWWRRRMCGHRKSLETGLRWGKLSSCTQTQPWYKLARPVSRVKRNNQSINAPYYSIKLSPVQAIHELDQRRG